MSETGPLTKGPQRIAPRGVSVPARPSPRRLPLTEAEEDEELETDELLAVQLQRVHLQRELLRPQHQAVQQRASLRSYRAQLHLGGQTGAQPWSGARWGQFLPKPQEPSQPLHPGPRLASPPSHDPPEQRAAVAAALTQGRCVQSETEGPFTYKDLLPGPVAHAASVCGVCSEHSVVPGVGPARGRSAWIRVDGATPQLTLTYTPRVAHPL